MTGDDLRDFVNQELFPYLQGFKQKAGGSSTIEYKIGEIFIEIRNSRGSARRFFGWDQDKLTPLLRLKYHDSISDAVADLGKAEEIGRAFSGFQRYLYERKSAA